MRPQPGDMLVRVTAPQFVAGFIIRDDVCIDAAPILAWTIGRRVSQLRRQFRSRGWKAAVVSHSSLESLTG